MPACLTIIQWGAPADKLCPGTQRQVCFMVPLRGGVDNEGCPGIWSYGIHSVRTECLNEEGLKNRRRSWEFKNTQLAETKNSVGKLEDRVDELSWKVEQRAK